MGEVMAQPGQITKSESAVVRVFVSYAREDLEFASRLNTDLTAAGFDTWIDQRNIVAGSHWDDSIQEALDGCTHMVIVLSPASVRSNNVLDEFNYAYERTPKHYTIVPLLAEECVLPFRMQRLQWIDFRAKREVAFSELCGQLRRSPRTPWSLRPISRTLRPGKAGRSLSLSLALATLVAGVGGTTLFQRRAEIRQGAGCASTSTQPAAAAGLNGNFPMPEEPRAGLRALQLYYAQDRSADALATAGEWLKARASFDKALLQPGIPPHTARHWRAARQFSEGRFQELDDQDEKAEVAYRDAIGTEPEWSLPHLVLAGILAGQRRFEEALSEAGEAEALDEQLWLAPVVVGSVRAAQGRSQEAIAELHRAERLAPNATRVLAALALAYHVAGTDDRNAEQYARKALEHDPSLAEPRIILTETALEEGQLEDAMRQSEQAIENAGRSAAVWLVRGDVLQRAGRVEEAKSAWRKALSLREQFGDDGAPKERLDEVQKALQQGSAPDKRQPPRKKSEEATRTGPPLRGSNGSLILP
jgi:tetratricopeptide (TPR) repeat protein